MGSVSLAVAVALVGALVRPVPVGSGSAAPEAVRTSVPLTGGASGLSQALEATHPFDRATAIADAARMAYENPPGESADTDRIRRNLREYVALVRQAPKGRRPAPPDTVPLPLSPRLWSDAILPRRVRDGDIALAILESREAALMYVGLSALDDETLAFLAGDRTTLTRIAREAPGVFATLGRSLHIHDGRVVLPGGAEARPLWESVALQDPDQPAAFFMRVLLEGAGRLAFLYDTVAHLDPPALRFALGLDLPTDVQVARFRELYRVFLESYPSWQVERRPFSRPPLDGAMLFRLLRFDAEGHLAGPAWLHLWRTVLAERLEGPEAGLLGDAPSGLPGPVDPAIRIDAAWTAAAVLSGLTQAGRPRLGALLFAQRVFADRSPSDAPDLAVALRGYLAFPALALSLERMGIRDPALYARATERAATLSAIASTSETAVALAEFQSLVAILERARRQGSLAPVEIEALLGSLVALEPDHQVGYRGAIGRWIESALLPAVWRAAGGAPGSSSAEGSLTRVLAGRTVNADDRLPSVEWEGRQYRIDPAGAELDRLRAVRGRQRGLDLDRALAFCRATVPPPGEAGADLESAATAALEASRGLPAPAFVQGYTSVQVPAPEDAARTAFRSPGGEEAGARALLRSLADQCDAMLADVLISLVYAMNLGSPDSPALSAGNVAMRHEFGLTVRRAAPWQRLVAWDQPREETGSGWHVAGSLLGLDVALARLALRNLASDTMPTRPSLNANERRTFTEGAALMNPFALRDQERDALTRAIERGRQRVEALGAGAETPDRVATDAHLSEWRRFALRWMIENDPGAIPRAFSMLELLWLGAPVEVPPGRLDAWGVSAVPLDEGWRTLFPQPAAWEEFAGRPMNGQLATRVPDLVLRVAVELSRRRLPARLAPGVVTVATNDLLYEAQPAYHDDWLAIVRYVLDLPAERFSDYISSLTADGPMTPAGETRGGEPR
jgi:hypothetical protein